MWHPINLLPSRNKNSWREECSIWTMALASFCKADIILWFLFNPQMWWSLNKWELDSNSWSLCRRVGFIAYNKITIIISFCLFQFINITNSHKGRRVWLFTRSRTTALYWKRCREKSCSSSIQFLYLWIWPCFSSIGATTRVCTSC